MIVRNSAYHIFYSVPSSEVANYIKDMENDSYALAYINSHSVNSSLQYSLIFKYMANVEFIISITSRLKQLKSEIDNHKLNGYQLTLLYNSDDIDNIAVLAKTNINYSHGNRLTVVKHENLYWSKSHNDSLLSTTVTATDNGKTKYSSVYVHKNVTSHHLPKISVSELPEALDEQLKQKFYLNHLTTIPTKPPSYSAVFHKMIKPSENYIMSKNLELDEAKKLVQTQINKGLNPLVVAGVETPSGLKFIVSLKH